MTNKTVLEAGIMGACIGFVLGGLFVLTLIAASS